MAQVMPWGGTYKLIGELSTPTNAFTLDSASLGVLDGNNYLNGRVTDDLTDRVLNIEISRGRNDQFTDFQTGTMTLTLANNDRELDPVNQSSRFWDPVTYTSGVTIRRKMTLYYGDTPIFTGRIADVDIAYEPTSSPNTRSTVVIDVVDDFNLLANIYLETYNPATQLSGARVNAILALAEVAYAGATNIAVGTISCLDDPIADQTRLLDALQAVNATERGSMFYEGDGTLVFTNRLTGSPVSPKVFADDGTGQSYATQSIVYGQENLFNRITAIPIDSLTPGFAEDSASQASFGILGMSLSGLLCSDAVAQTLAEYILSLFSTPSYRFDQMGVVFVGNNISVANQQTIIDLELGDAVRVVKTFATGSPTKIYQNVVIEHIQHSISPQQHNISYRFSPASFTTYAKTATGSGTGSAAADGYKIVLKTASGTGGATAGDEAVGLHIAPRDATGTGTGTQTAEGLHTAIRTATGDGSATAGDTAIGLHIAPRTATGDGTGSSTVTVLHTVYRDATGTGTGGATALRLLTAFSTATGTGTGGATAIGLRIVDKTASGSGGATAGSAASGEVKYLMILDDATAGKLDVSILAEFGRYNRTATGSGAGSETAIRLRIVPRTATGAGIGSSLAEGAKTLALILDSATMGLLDTNTLDANKVRTASGSGGATAGDTAIGSTSPVVILDSATLGLLDTNTLAA